MKHNWSDAQRQAQSERMKRRNADPAFRARMRALYATPEFKEAARGRMETLWARPEFRARQRKNKVRETRAARQKRRYAEVKEILRQKYAPPAPPVEAAPVVAAPVMAARIETLTPDQKFARRIGNRRFQDVTFKKKRDVECLPSFGALRRG